MGKASPGDSGCEKSELFRVKQSPQISISCTVNRVSSTHTVLVRRSRAAAKEQEGTELKIESGQCVKAMMSLGNHQ